MKLMVQKAMNMTLVQQKRASRLNKHFNCIDNALNRNLRRHKFRRTD
jgi:hypothetical protein